MNLAELIDPIEEPKPTHVRKAVLLSGDNLLAQAIAVFFNARKEWEIIKIHSNRNACSLVEQVQRIQPDVVIYCQGEQIDNSLLTRLILLDQPDLKVIVVGLENNLLQVYTKHSFMVREVSDFYSIIENGYLPDGSI